MKLSRLALLSLLLVPSACTDDGPAGPNGSGGGDATAPAYMFVNRVRTPDSRTNYVSVFDTLDAREADLERALPVPAASRFLTYEGRIYVYEGETGEVVRYAVAADLSLVEEGRFSMVNLGIVGFRTSTIFLSPERAYYIDPTMEQVVVWNPTLMEITGTFAAPGLRSDTFPITSIGVPQRVGDQVVAPLGFRTADQSASDPRVFLLVLEAERNETVGIVEDARCGVSTTGVVFDGRYYVLGDYDAGGYRLLDPMLPPPCLLRYDPTSGGFDPNYALDLEAVTGAPAYAGVFGPIDGKVVMRTYDAPFAYEDIPDMLDSPAEYYGLELWRWSVLDLEAETSAAVSSLPLTGLSFNPAVVDDRFYVPQIDEETQTSQLFAVTPQAPAMATASVSATGDIVGVGRVR